MHKLKHFPCLLLGRDNDLAYMDLFRFFEFLRIGFVIALDLGLRYGHAPVHVVGKQSFDHHIFPDVRFPFFVVYIEPRKYLFDVLTLLGANLLDPRIDVGRADLDPSSLGFLQQHLPLDESVQKRFFNLEFRLTIRLKSSPIKPFLKFSERNRVAVYSRHNLDIGCDSRR
jgi:hypothetical protein